MSGHTSSIVEYFSKQQRSCGYCSSDNGSHSYGLHAHTMTVEDYQNMIDRGWRRCGQYCYKPELQKSCCPLYSIRYGICACSRCCILLEHPLEIERRFN